MNFAKKNPGKVTVAWEITGEILVYKVNIQFIISVKYPWHYIYNKISPYKKNIHAVHTAQIGKPVQARHTQHWQ